MQCPCLVNAIHGGCNYHSSRQGFFVVFFFIKRELIFFLFLDENICCGYSLEAPRRGASNEYHNIWFCREIRKILVSEKQEKY